MPSPEAKGPAPARLPVEGGLVLLVALLCLWFQVRLPMLEPSDADYQQLQQVLEAEAQPGDALLLFPWWTERARMFSPDRVKVVGYQGSDGDPLELNPRVWVLSQPDLPKSDETAFVRAFSDRRTAVGAERIFGRLHLTLYANGRARPVRFSFVDQIAQASVYLEGGDGSRTPCIWDGRAHRCPGGGFVAAEWHEILFQPRRCVRLYPPGGATKLVVELNGVPAADAFAVMGGYTWDRGYLHTDVGDTYLVADVNGAQAAKIDLPKAREGLQRVDAAAVPQGATVRISSQAPNPVVREVCVEGYGFGT